MIPSALFFIAYSILTLKENRDSFEAGLRFIFYTIGAANVGWAIGEVISR